MQNDNAHNSNRWQRLEELFHVAVEYNTVERKQFLVEACNGDLDLISEVESLLAADEKPQGFLDGHVYTVTAEALLDLQGDLRQGSNVGHYEIVRPLGKGGMGRIYQATDQHLGRDIALKFLTDISAHSHSAINRFIKEARATSALNHPNIVTIYGISETDLGHCIAMELVTGSTLREMMQGPLPIEQIFRIGEQVARALKATHNAAIVHRDIKPENIMVRDDGLVKIVDFGIARLIDAATPSQQPQNMTDSGVVIGTAAYMSPEQARGESVTAASDVFSFGIVLYEMATGRHPFSSASQPGLTAAILTQEAAAPSAANPKVPPKFDLLILRMLMKDPRFRPSVAEVEKVLAERAASDNGSGEIADIQPLSGRKTVGREIERSQLRAAFRGAIQGHSLICCVTGEAGIGKTTLVEDFINEVREGGLIHLVARGRSSERLGGNEAYLPILEALGYLARSSGGDAFIQMLKRIAPTWYTQIAPSLHVDLTDQSFDLPKAPSQERLKLELAAFLEELSRSWPLILFLDDLHWADNATIELLTYIATRFDRIRVLIVATYRSSDMLLADHPFLRIKLELQGRRLCEEIALGFLNYDDVKRYVDCEFRENIFQKTFIDLIFKKTAGAPLFLVEVLDYLRQHNIVAELDGVWTLREALPDMESDLPQSVRSMIQRKIDRLSGEDRRLLIAASLQGFEFDSTVVAETLGIDEADLEERLEYLERIHSLINFTDEFEFPDGTLTQRYYFAHVLYQNALWSLPQPTRKATLSAKIAQVLLTHYGEQAHALAADLAVLFETARDYAQAADYFFISSKNASQLFAYQEAVVLAKRGLELLSRLPPTPERDHQEILLQSALGGPLMAVRGFTDPEVARTYGRARELCQRVDESAQLFPALWGLWAYYYSTATIKEAYKVAVQMLRLAETGQQIDSLMMAHHITGVTLLHMGELQAARSHLEAAFAISDPQQDRSIIRLIQQSSITTILSFNAMALWTLGYPEQASKMIRKAVAIAKNLAHPPSLAATLLYSALVSQFRRDVLMTEDQSRASLMLSAEYGFPLFLLSARILQGWARVQQEPAGAIAQMSQSLAALKAAGTELGRAYYLSLLAEALASQDELEEALKTLDEALAGADTSGDLLGYADLYRLKGDLLTGAAEAGRGDRSSEDNLSTCDGERHIQKAIKIARAQQAKSLELRAVTSLARLWQRQGKMAEARQALAEVYAWFTEGFDTVDLQAAKALLDELSPS